MGLNYKTYLPKRAGYIGGKSKKQVEADGKKVYKLSSNENPLGTSPLAVEAVLKYVSTLSEYPSPSDKALRNALSNFYNNELSAEQFITSNSGVANIELIVRAFLDEQSECIYCSPYFSPYKAFPKQVGAKTRDIPLVGSDFQLNVEGIITAVNDRTAILFLTSPNNPTGSYLKKAQLDELFNFLPDHVLVVFDEVYFQYAETNDYIRALPYVLNNRNVIAVNSFSKAYGMAGLRVGYSYTTIEIAKYLQKNKRPFAVNTLSTEATIAGLKDQKFIHDSVNLIHREKRYLYEELDKIGIKYWKTEANFIMMEPDISPKEFEYRMIQNGVMIRTLEGFGAPTAIRVTIGSREGNIAFVKSLHNILH